MKWFKKDKAAAGSAASKNQREKLNEAFDQELSSTIGKKRSFAMAEAHKRLRTNIMFSYADEGKCHVIGLTSAMAHEGKSTTSINLAYDLMKAGKKVLLIDADMRLSRMAKVLEVNRAPGLSNVLVGKSSLQAVIQRVELLEGLKMITCGDIPPNPTELLASKRFAAVLDALKGVYEYVIIDLPPVTEVSDALIVSKLTDGILIVVRQDFVDKRLLDDTVHQLGLSEARIVGLVLTCAQRKSKYGKYKYSKNLSKSRGGYGGYGYYKSGPYGYYRGRSSGSDSYWQEATTYEQAAQEAAEAEAAAQNEQTTTGNPSEKSSAKDT